MADTILGRVARFEGQAGVAIARSLLRLVKYCCWMRQLLPGRKLNRDFEERRVKYDQSSCFSHHADIAEFCDYQ